MKNLVCLVMMAVLAGITCVASVPAKDEHSVERARRSNPWDLFNTNTKKVVKKKPQPQPQPQPKPTTSKPATSTPATSAPAIKTTIPPSVVKTKVRTLKNQMPDYIAQKLGKLKTEAQVQQFFGINAAMSQKISISKKNLSGPPGVSGQTSGSSDASEWTWSTSCLPRPQVIRFPQPNLYHGVIYPFCTMAKRCGGCCYVEMHHCVPKQVQYVHHPAYYVPYSMVSSQFSNGNSRKKRSSSPELRVLVVENHISCKCQCKVRPEHCDPKRQYHHESTCQCKCKDDFTESRLKCGKDFQYHKDTCRCKCAYHHQHCPVAKQKWNNKKCKCMCDPGIRCPNKQAINKNTCECENV